jgi:thiopeptide-type bacteriocin biosynthesis protein
MKDRVEGFEPAGFFVLRTPLLPFDELRRWRHGDADDACDLAPGGPADLEGLRARLRAVFRRPEIAEALYVASPGLSDARRSASGDHALARYFSRMAARPTPFGLFAGISLGAISDRTKLELGPRAAYRRNVRVDVEPLVAAAAAAARDPRLGARMRYRTNGSAYVTGDRVRFVEIAGAERPLSGAPRLHQLVEVDASDAVQAVITRAAHGASRQDLCGAVRDAHPEISAEEADAFIAELVESGLLEPELAPRVTGGDPLAHLVGELDALGAPGEAGDIAPGEAGDIAQRLAAVDRDLGAIRAAPLGVAREAYDRAASLLAPFAAEGPHSSAFQVDLGKPSPHLSLGTTVADELLRGVAVLHALLDQPMKDALDSFRERFVARYDRREVPLLEALDEETGLGFYAPEEPTPVVGRLPFAQPAGGASVDAHGAKLLPLLEDSLRRGRTEVVLEPRDVERLTGTGPRRLPDAFEVLATVLAGSNEDIERGDYRVHIVSYAGPSGANMIGRFAWHDARLEQAVREHFLREEAHRPEAIFAEIVHLPEGRAGNVVFRPVLRGYEIPFFGRSGVPEERKIPLTDLRISATGSRFVLRSKRLGREVLPRLAAAHNFYDLGLATYRFLCALQGQGVTSGFWSWGTLDALRFLPDVRVGRVLLSRARWRLTKGEAQAIAGLRAELGLPRFVGWAQGESMLPVDLDNPLAVAAFTERARSREEVVLHPLPTERELCVRGPEGSFAHELVVPFVRKASARRALIPPPARIAPREVSSSQRTFMPGSRWLYAKLYAGPANAERLLATTLAKRVAELREARLFERWFFIRYADPDTHLRLRFEGDRQLLWGPLLRALEDTAREALESGRLQRMELGTYERESERYGGDEGTTLAEQIFEADSDAALEIVGAVRGALDDRFRAALLGTERMLVDFGFTERDRVSLLEGAAIELGRELGATEATKHRLGEKFRAERGRMAELTPVVAAAFDRCSHRIRPIALRAREGIASGRISAALETWAMDHVHMRINRLLRSAHRRQELAIYDFARRMLVSSLARNA